LKRRACEGRLRSEIIWGRGTAPEKPKGIYEERGDAVGSWGNGILPIRSGEG